MEYLYRHNVYPGCSVHYQKYKITKETPCGHWINDYARKRWVSKTAIKRFANPTQEEAAYALFMRKTQQVRILDAQLRSAKEMKEKARLNLVEKRWEKPNNSFNLFGGN
jgi:hypothetical protein